MVTILCGNVIIKVDVGHILSMWDVLHLVELSEHTSQGYGVPSDNPISGMNESSLVRIRTDAEEHHLRYHCMS